MKARFGGLAEMGEVSGREQTWAIAINMDYDLAGHPACPGSGLHG
jgi:hypothetical protein